MRGKKLRIECNECDTGDGDGLTLTEARKSGWTKIRKIVSPPSDSPFDWATHHGVCPSCGQPELFSEDICNPQSEHS